jgi:ketosteroid isomerase-like protein
MASVPEAVLSAMRATNDRFNTEVVQNHNLNELDRVYTEDARILPPGADMIQGREAIKAFWQQAIQSMGVKSAKLTTVDAEMLGDGIFEIGRADLMLNDGQTVGIKYVVRWKQEQNDWKWHVDIWNPNQ